MESRKSKAYDFSRGRRGVVIPSPPGKTRITIRLDNEIIAWFRSQVESRGGGSYQSMINDVLKEHVRRSGTVWESHLRRIIREELNPRNRGQASAEKAG